MRSNRAHRIGKKIAKRAHELDGLTPGWADKVNPRTIDLMDNESCILGQVYGHVGKSPYGFLEFSGFVFLTTPSLAHATKCWREQVLSRKNLYVPPEWADQLPEKTSV